MCGPALFLVMYYSIRQPRAYARELYEVYFVATVVAFGFGYVISLYLHEKQAIVASILVQLVFTMLSGVTPTLHVLYSNWFTGILSSINVCRWLQEWSVIIELEYYRNIYNTTTTYEMLMYDSAFDEPAKAKKLYRNYALIIGLVAHLMAISIISGAPALAGKRQLTVVTPLTGLSPHNLGRRGISDEGDLEEAGAAGRCMQGQKAEASAVVHRMMSRFLAKVIYS